MALVFVNNDITIMHTITKSIRLKCVHNWPIGQDLRSLTHSTTCFCSLNGCMNDITSFNARAFEISNAYG